MDPKTMILGSGHAVPERILTNSDLEAMVSTSDQWIVERTGIRQRHIAEPGAALSDLAAAAALAALENAGLQADAIDLIILGTVSGDMKFPATACFVQEKIGAHNAVAFDVSAACSGFLYSLQVASALLQGGVYRHALVIGGEILSALVDWQDRDTCVLFGDGAGAVVLGPSREGRGLLGACMTTDGRHTQLLHSPGGGSLHPSSPESLANGLHFIRMEGREVFRHAVLSMEQALQKALQQAGVGVQDLDLLIPHQANLRIIEAVGKRFDFPAERTFVNVDRFGNTSAASIPIALDEARRSGRLQAGDLVGLVTFGAGFTAAAAVLRI